MIWFLAVHDVIYCYDFKFLRPLYGLPSFARFFIFAVELLVTPLVVIWCRIIGDSCSSVSSDLVIGDYILALLGLESVVVSDSSNLQSELGAIAYFSTTSLESVIGDSSFVLRGRVIKTLLRVTISGLPWSFIKDASLYGMGNLGHSCLVDIVEQLLWVGSVSLSEVTRVKSLEDRRLNAVFDGLGGLTLLVSDDVVLVIDFTVRYLAGIWLVREDRYLGEGHWRKTEDVAADWLMMLWS